MSRPLLLDNIESRILRGGDKMTGALQLKGAPTSDLEAATKKYVDDNTPDTANAALKLAQSRNLAVSDNSGSNTGPSTGFDGTANATMKLPATIKATLDGNASSASKLTTTSAGSDTQPVYFANGVPAAVSSTKPLNVSISGNAATADHADEATHAENADNATNATEAAHAAAADTATNATTAGTCTGNAATATRLASSTAVGSTTAPIYFSNGTPQPCGGTLAVAISGKAASADKLNTNAGSATLPVYFDAGIPKACNTDLAVNVTGSSGSCTGNAATATTLKTARNFSITDNDGTNSGPTTSFNGGAAAVIKLPSTIKASLSGNASTATKLATARTISLTGDVTGSGSFDGSGNLSIATTVANGGDYLPLSGGDMTGSIRTSFKQATAMGSYQAEATTVEGLAEELRYSSGAMGSVSISTAYVSGGGGTIAAGWYNFIYSPHRSGGNSGAADGDNHNYGTLILAGMSGNFGLWHIRISSGAIGKSQRIWEAGDSVTGAVWNDYAEYREADTIEPGYVLIENGDDTLSKSTERLSHFAGISSDTWGFSQGETEKAKTPIAVAGRVLVYPY